MNRLSLAMIVTLGWATSLADFSWDYHDLLFTPVKETASR